MSGQQHLVNIVTTEPLHGACTCGTTIDAPNLDRFAELVWIHIDAVSRQACQARHPAYAEVAQ